MNKPVHQHFIPRSYLNNFGIKIKDKCFISGKKLDSSKIYSLSTKDICVDKNLYTIPTSDENKKFDIEHFYANNIDSKFPEIYKILKDKNITNIDFETRLKIITTSLSLYFRTPKYLNIQNAFFDKIVSELIKDSPEDEIMISLFDEKIIIKKSEAKQIIKEKRENNRIKFLFEHLQNYEKFVQSKLVDTICVYHISDESEFITCDNPVIIRPFANPTDPQFDYTIYYNQEINPFDSSNMIHLPIDNKTILIILPSTEKQSDGFLQRLDIGLIDVLMYNSDIEKHSETWILGSEKGVVEHLKNQQKYNEINSENLNMINDYKDKVFELIEFSELLQKHGTKSEIIKEKIKIMKSKPHIFSDLNFQRFLKQIEAEK